MPEGRVELPLKDFQSPALPLSYSGLLSLTGFEPVLIAYQATVLPLNYKLYQEDFLKP